MTTCFLCNQYNVKMSLEHSIPKFLGGKKSDDKFKKINLCKSCNSALGTHVDARFARSFFNAMELSDFKNDLFQGHFTSIYFEDDDIIHKFIPKNNHIEMMVNDRVNVFWVKENTEDFLGLVGGHAPLSKSKYSQLFIFITKEDIQENEVKELLEDIRKKFKDYNKMEILLCVDFVFNNKKSNIDMSIFRDDIKNYFNIKGLKFIWEFTEEELVIKERLGLSNKENHNCFKSSILFDLNDFCRFLSKLFLGVLCGYLGNDFLRHPIGVEMIETIKTYQSRQILSEHQLSKLRVFFENPELFKYLFEEKSITISIIGIRENICGFLCINNKSFFLKICSKKDLSEDSKKILNIGLDDSHIPQGKMLILEYESEKYKELSVQDFFLKNLLSSKFPSCSEDQIKDIVKLYSLME